MELRLWNLLSHEEMELRAVPRRDWRYLSAGGRHVFLIDSEGVPALFHVREDGEGVEPMEVFSLPGGLTCGAVSSLGDGGYAICDAFGNVFTVPDDRAEGSRVRAGVQMLSYSDSLVILDRNGNVRVRSRAGAWRDADVSGVYKISAGRSEHAFLERNGRVHITDPGGIVSPAMERKSRALGRVTDIAETSAGVAVLREGRLYLDGRMVITGSGDLVSLSCGISDTLECIVCRRGDGSFLSILTGPTFSPSSLGMEAPSQIKVYEAGDRFLACLI